MLVRSERPYARMHSRSSSRENSAVDSTVYSQDVDVSDIDEKRLMRKVDLYVVPWLSFLYLLSFLDRGTIGNAKLYNLEQDIGITDKQYLIALTVFFFPYALLEPASNVFLRRVKPSIWLSTMMLLWGIVTTMHGVINNYSGLITVRVLLGAAEAGLYPGIVFYISSWYKRSEMGSRIALFFSSATVAGAFSGLLAAAIANMDGIGGKAGWEWIFILEGLFTVVIAIISYWVIQDFPDEATFLSEPESCRIFLVFLKILLMACFVGVFIIRRLQADLKLSAAGEKFSSTYIWQSLTDRKTWIAMGIYMGFDGPLYAFSLFLPTIINQVGFRANKANLLSVPVYAWGCLLTCAVGFLGDRVASRGRINLALFGIGLAAYIILILSRSPALSYFAVYLAVSAIYPIIPNSVAWVASNVEGSYKRSVTLGMAIGFGNLNGAVTANIYRAKDRPWYRLGHTIVLVYIAIGFTCSVIYMIMLRRENDRRDRGDRDEVIEGLVNKNANKLNGTYASLDEAKRDRGDDWSGFRYTL